MIIYRRLRLVFLIAPMMLVAIFVCSIFDAAVFLLKEIKNSAINAYLTLKAGW